jgi:hypothetical protein
MRLMIALALPVAMGLLAPQASLAAGYAECPWQPIADKPAAAVAKLLPSGNALADDADIRATITSLREAGLSSGAIVDSIISAYCPVIAGEADVTAAQKADAVEAYAARVTDMVYTYSDADEIILDIALPPSVVTDVQTQASRAGLSADAWVASIVERALADETP